VQINGHHIPCGIQDLDLAVADEGRRHVATDRVAIYLPDDYLLVGCAHVVKEGRKHPALASIVALLGKKCPKYGSL
jgi:hypothetical protein